MHDFFCICFRTASKSSVGLLNIKDDSKAFPITHPMAFRPVLFGSVDSVIAEIQQVYHGPDYLRRRMIDLSFRKTDRSNSQRLRNNGQPGGRGLRRIDTFSLKDLDYVEFYDKQLPCVLVSCLAAS